jgi:hypothetical protein
MSLREQFAPDARRIHLNPDEHASEREFRINNGLGGFTVFTAIVVWDEPAAEQRPMVTKFGVYMGDVICYIMAEDLPRAPVAGELIYSPANRPFEVIKCTDEEGVYMLGLAAYRSQPGHYGSN